MYSNRKWYGSSGGGRRGTGGAGFTLSMNHYHHHYGMRDDFASNKIASNLVFLLLVGFLFFLSQFIIMSRLNPDSLINPKHHKNKYSAMENLNTGGRDFLIQKHIKEHEEVAIERNQRRLKFQQVESKTDILKAQQDKRANQGQMNQETNDNSADPHQKATVEDPGTPRDDVEEVAQGPNGRPEEDNKNAGNVDEDAQQPKQPETPTNSETVANPEPKVDVLNSDSSENVNQQEESVEIIKQDHYNVEHANGGQVPAEAQKLSQSEQELKEETQKANVQAVQTDPLLDSLDKHRISSQTEQDANSPEVKKEADGVQNGEEKRNEAETGQNDNSEEVGTVDDVSVEHVEKSGTEENESNNEQDNQDTQSSRTQEFKPEDEKGTDDGSNEVVKETEANIHQANDKASIEDNLENKFTNDGTALHVEENVDVQLPRNEVESQDVGLENPAVATERKDLADLKNSRTDIESKSLKHSSEEM